MWMKSMQEDYTQQL
uniref:Uncharacterized protein n=1 Tax=Arundo donax TaxID=35708 RepID=A0A0A8YMS5_ARUDO